MTDYPSDVTYACLHLGIKPGATSEHIHRVRTFAEQYRFITKPRLAQVIKLTNFFLSRAHFGEMIQGYNDIRSGYFRLAKQYHPDLHPGDQAAEDYLKILNTAFADVEAINRESRDYFQQAEYLRRGIEAKARAQAQREAQAAVAPSAVEPVEKESDDQPPRPAHPPLDDNLYPPPNYQGNMIVYMACSVPRFVRTARLSYLPPHTIITSYLVRTAGSNGIMYDVIMLPEQEFKRARYYLSGEVSGAPQLTLGKSSAVFIPFDTRQVRVKAVAQHAQSARDYFLPLFQK